MQRIAIDMDEVIADFLTKYVSAYNAEFQGAITKEQLMGLHLSEIVDEAHRPRLQEFMRDETFFSDLPVMPGSQEVIRELMNQYEIFITTAAMEVPASFAAKYEWLGKHFPFIPHTHIVFCGDKSILHADFLIDDTARHFKRFRGEGILFTAPHNIHVTGYRRVKDWQEVREMFLTKSA
jgi:5'(3')-deoxyribonucleotidase